MLGPSRASMSQQRAAVRTVFGDRMYTVGTLHEGVVDQDPWAILVSQRGIS